MKITRAEKYLALSLRLIGLTMEQACGMVMFLDTVEKQDTMMLWIASHPDATPWEAVQTFEKLMNQAAA